MTDAQAAALYWLLVIPPLLVTFVVAVVLGGLHLFAIHGRRLLPERIHRVAGWMTFGLLLGLTSQAASTQPAIWAAVLGTGIFIIVWGWHAGRLADVGVGLSGSALPWAFSVGLFLVLIRPDPTVGIPDVRLAVVAAALAVLGLGVILVIASPSAPDREQTASRRLARFYGEFDRVVAMGPIPAPMAVAIVAGVAASTVMLILLGRNTAPLIAALASGVTMFAVATGTWLLATPARVRDAATALWWLTNEEGRIWGARLGTPVPPTRGGLGRFLERTADRDDVRPLRIESLAVLGRVDEARTELARLAASSPEDRATAAEYAAFGDWIAGMPGSEHIERLAAALEEIDDPRTRLRLRVSLAMLRAKRAVDAGDPTAIDHMASVRSEIPDAPSYVAIPPSRIVVVAFAVFALVGPVLSLLVV